MSLLRWVTRFTCSVSDSGQLNRLKLLNPDLTGTRVSSSNHKNVGWEEGLIRILSLAILFATAAWSQTTGAASLVGTISDSSGAAVPSAKIIVQNQETSFRL